MQSSDDPQSAGDTASSDDTSPSTGAPRPRRPYVAPAIEESADFETLALSCTLDPQGCVPEPDDPDQQARS